MFVKQTRLEAFVRTAGSNRTAGITLVVSCLLATACGSSTMPHDPVDASVDTNDGGADTKALVMYGGIDASVDAGNVAVEDTWTFSAGAWAKGAGGPGTHYAPSMAALGGKAILFGGADDTANSTADTWQWDGAAWTKLGATGPLARQDAAMATLGSQIVLFGGINVVVADGAMYLGDTWIFDGAAWTKSTATGPGARSDPMMATLGDKVVLFGGQNGGGADSFKSDTWEWDGSSWTQRDVSGPSARTEGSMTTLGDKVVLFGGRGAGNGYLGDTWEWDGSSWTQRHVSGPPAREHAVFVTVGARAILFGGDDGIDFSNTFGDTWAWDGSSWTQLQVSGPMPTDKAAGAAL